VTGAQGDGMRLRGRGIELRGGTQVVLSLDDQRWRARFDAHSQSLDVLQRFTGANRYTRSYEDLFVDFQKEDFKPRYASPAVGRGLDLVDEVPRDIEGRPRSRRHPDVGPYAAPAEWWEEIDSGRALIVDGNVPLDENGCDRGLGTAESPFATLAKAIAFARWGSRIYVKDSIYRHTAMQTSFSLGPDSTISGFPGHRPAFSPSECIDPAVTAWDFGFLVPLGATAPELLMRMPSDVDPNQEDPWKFTVVDDCLYVWLPDGEDPRQHSIEAACNSVNYVSGPTGNHATYLDWKEAGRLREDWPALKVYRTEIDFGRDHLGRLWHHTGPMVWSQGFELDPADPSGRTLHLLDDVRLDAGDPPGQVAEKVLIFNYLEGDPNSPQKREHRVGSKEIGPDRRVVLPSRRCCSTATTAPPRTSRLPIITSGRTAISFRRWAAAWGRGGTSTASTTWCRIVCLPAAAASSRSGTTTSAAVGNPHHGNNYLLYSEYEDPSHSRIDYNCYWKDLHAVPGPLSASISWGKEIVWNATAHPEGISLAEFHEKTGYEAHGLAPASYFHLVANPLRFDFRPLPDSPLLGAGAALDTQVGDFLFDPDAANGNQRFTYKGNAVDIAGEPRGDRPSLGAYQNPLPGAKAYHVAPDGKDAPERGTRTAPLATVACGLSRMRPGDLLVLRPGRYSEPIVINRSGTPRDFLHIVAENPPYATPDKFPHGGASVIDAAGMGGQPALLLDGCAHVRVAGLRVTARDAKAQWVADPITVVVSGRFAGKGRRGDRRHAQEDNKPQTMGSVVHGQPPLVASTLHTGQAGIKSLRLNA